MNAASILPGKARRGWLLVLSGPSGCGKTTLARRLEERAAGGGLVRSVSVTTRPPRPGEREGRDYFFVSSQRFHELVNRGKLLEHREMFGYRYGTPRAPVEQRLAEGTNVVLVLDAEGRRQLVARYGIRVVSVFLLPPSLAELERRLRGRDQDSAGSLRRRLAAAREEMAGSVAYDYAFVNHDLEKTLAALAEVLRRLRPRADLVAACST
jgi:guanylate kinase